MKNEKFQKKQKNKKLKIGRRQNRSSNTCWVWDRSQLLPENFSTPLGTGIDPLPQGQLLDLHTGHPVDSCIEVPKRIQHGTQVEPSAYLALIRDRPVSRNGTPKVIRLEGTLCAWIDFVRENSLKIHFFIIFHFLSIFLLIFK